MFNNTQRKHLYQVVAGGLLAALSSVYAPSALAADPWEGTNRKLFQFNQYFDGKVVKPVATIYSTMVPPVMQQGVGNFFSNINDLTVTVNDLLQLKMQAAASDSARVLINSTVGIGGLFDVATPIGLEKNEEDFGQTFGAWGVPAGPYVVIPTVGSSTVRDAVGWALGLAFNPFVYYGDRSVSVPAYTLDQISTRAGLLAFDELVFGDEYIFVREAYMQRREYLILDGEVEDEFGDF